MGGPGSRFKCRGAVGMLALPGLLSVLPPAPDAPEPTSSLAARVPPPPGYHRLPVPEDAFAAWLRRLPLKPDCPPVHLFDGRKKARQDVHAAVVDLDVGQENLQQCADAVIRLRAEWLWASGRKAEIRFRFTSGALALWSRWAAGDRPVFGPRHSVTWSRTAEADDSYPNFRRYLDTVFRCAGTASLARELRPVADPRDVRPGDVFICGGYPGHAVLVADAAEDSAGRRVFLLLQSHMPAQEIHLLKNPKDDALSPWYSVDFKEQLVTPEWTFTPKKLRRFGP